MKAQHHPQVLISQSVEGMPSSDTVDFNQFKITISKVLAKVDSQFKSGEIFP